LLVDGIGRPEVERLNAEFRGEEPLGEVQLQVGGGDGDFADVRMAPGVVADLVAIAVDALEVADVVQRLFADDEERAGGMLLPENLQNLRRPCWVWAVVKAERDLFGVV